MTFIWGFTLTFLENMAKAQGRLLALDTAEWVHGLGARHHLEGVAFRDKLLCLTARLHLEVPLHGDCALLLWMEFKNFLACGNEPAHLSRWAIITR